MFHFYFVVLLSCFLLGRKLANKYLEQSNKTNILQAASLGNILAWDFEELPALTVDSSRVDELFGLFSKRQHFILPVLHA